MDWVWGGRCPPGSDCSFRVLMRQGPADGRPGLWGISPAGAGEWALFPSPSPLGSPFTTYLLRWGLCAWSTFITNTDPRGV